MQPQFTVRMSTSKTYVETIYLLFLVEKYEAVAACVCMTMAQNVTSVNHLLILETFPTRVRATAVSICRAMGVVTVAVTITLVNITDVEVSFFYLQENMLNFY